VEIIEARITLALSIIILALVTLQPSIAGWLADKTPPVVSFSRVETLNSPTQAGGVLIARIWREKVRDDCPVASQRYAVNEAGVTFDIPDGEWRGGPPGDEYLDFAYPMPPQMPSGWYELRVHLAYYCPNVAKPFEYDQPPVVFEISG
jgi:hypothetical protein